jgi:hypothetical protein
MGTKLWLNAKVRKMLLDNGRRQRPLVQALCSGLLDVNRVDHLFKAQLYQPAAAQAR